MPRFDYRTTAVSEITADLLIVPFFKGPQETPAVKEAGRALQADLLAILRSNRVRGDVGDAMMVPTLGRLPAEGILLLGVGPRDAATPEAIRRAIGKAAPRVAGYARVAAAVPQAGKGSFEAALQAFVEGLLLGSYRFDRYKANPGDEDGDRPRLERVTVLGLARWDQRAAKRAMERGRILAEATSWARDLVNMPAQDATPDFLAREAQKMARAAGLTCKVWSRAELEKGGFGGILGVGQGSVNTPRLIELRYRGGGNGPPLALAGKGITFDSGGLSIKDAKNMEWMKADMAGAASVLAAMRAIAELKPRIDVIAAIPAAENLPGGRAIRPGDVLRHRGGRTSEVLNTDAEGRLVLADALAFLVEQKPAAIVDAATLTGACAIALGDGLWGVMGTDRRLVRDLIDAGEAAGEPGWELPLWEGYRKQIESAVADAKNVGNRYGGAITAGLFLKEFVGDVPWAHMDIAGTAYSEKAGDFWPRGATGSPVRTLVGYVERRAASGAGAASGRTSRARRTPGRPPGRGPGGSPAPGRSA
ncbi:MAG: leucyl aminopeptidase [Actinomycetota bacterium]|nr:leucyl aminopeptidase [Actinomycetota bacterium]